MADELRGILSRVEGAPAPKKRGRPPGKTGKPVTLVARELLAGGPRTFAELWAAVEKTGGSKYALKSALGKGRERGEFTFDGERYSRATAQQQSREPGRKKALSGSSGKGQKAPAMAVTS